MPQSKKKRKKKKKKKTKQASHVKPPMLIQIRAATVKSNFFLENIVHKTSVTILLSALRLQFTRKVLGKMQTM